MTMHLNAHLGTIEVEGTAVPRVTIPQWSICRLGDERDTIETALLQGRSPWAIKQMVTSEVSERSIREHYSRGHLALPVEAAQARVRAAPPPTLVSRPWRMSWNRWRATWPFWMPSYAT